MIKALLSAHIEQLSDWVSHHDPPTDPGLSIGRYIVRHLASFVKLWSAHYKLSKRTRAFWIRALLSVSGTVTVREREHWENMILVVLFDRAQLIDRNLDELYNFGTLTLQQLQPVMGYVGPRMYVAILAALLMEFESFKYASEWL